MRLTVGRMHRAAFIGAATCALTIAGMASSVDWQPRNYDIAAQDLGHALRALAEQSGLQLAANGDLVQGKQSRPLKGSYTAEQALHYLLEGSGLTGEISDGTVIVGGRSGKPAPNIAASEENGSEIVVTGSRIRGARIASPVISLSADEARKAGQNSLGELVRSIPQSFGGGQNPGVGFTVPAGSGVNLGSGSSINLRGLGSDATLTLLNGHRLAYNSSRQSIDVSAIPLAAVDRIEVVADGASALYGSDAVAGVANIILKKDYQGVSTSARFGAATDGGDEQQQYGAVAGTRWSSGGVIFAYDFERDTPIVARERSYAAGRSPGLTLLPSLKHHSAVISGHQSIRDNLTFNIDADYNKRWSDFSFAFTSDGNPSNSGYFGHTNSSSFVISPSLKLDVSNNWHASLVGMYGFDHTHSGSEQYSGGKLATVIAQCYCNTASSAELNADGTLFNLPSGAVKIALGEGYRSQTFHATVTQGAPSDTKATQDVTYAFGELSVPLVSDAQGVPLFHSLSFMSGVSTHGTDLRL